MEEKKNEGLGCCIAFFIVIIIVLIPIIIGMFSNSIKVSNERKHEENLISEGKTKSSNEVLNEIIDIFKEKENRNIDTYLADEFSYYDSDNYEHKYIYSFYNDLKILNSSYEVERRGDSIGGIETYRIYWNVVEKNKANGVDKTSQYYCLQKITIMLKRVVKEDIITYEIERIILTDN